MMNPENLNSDPLAVHQINDAAEFVDDWAIDSWSSLHLVQSRAALRLMLTNVERELGKRGLMGQHR